MNKIKRPLREIYEDIARYEQLTAELRKEVKEFQAACPHPDNFVNVQRKSTEDEYGRTDGHYEIRTCVLCGFVEHKDVDSGKW